MAGAGKTPGHVDHRCVGRHRGGAGARFAANGHELVLVARREGTRGGGRRHRSVGPRRPTVLPVDVARAGAAQDVAAALAARELEPEIRRQQCGLWFDRRRERRSTGAEQLAMIDLNVRALTDFSLAFLDSLERRKGGILNVASVAASCPAPAWRSTTPPRPM